MTLFLLQAVLPPPPQPEAHSRRPGNALRKALRATSCPRAHHPGPRSHRAPARPGGIPEGGRRRKRRPRPRPLRARWAGPSPSRPPARPARGGRRSRRSHQVCFLAAGGWGRASGERRRAGGRAGERGSDVRPRGAFQPRAVRPSVRPGRYAARSPGAPRPPARTPRTEPQAAWTEKALGKVSAGRRGRVDEGRGARGQLGKFSSSGPEGEVASSGRVRWWVCELGGVCESRPQGAGGGRLGVPHPPGENSSGDLWGGGDPASWDPTAADGPPLALPG